MRSQLRTLQRLGLLVDLFGVDWSHLWLQSQDGSGVLTPDIQLYHYAGVLSNVASFDELRAKIRSMERATWEALALIRTRSDVDDALAALLEAAPTAASALQGVPQGVPLVRVPSVASSTGADLSSTGADLSSTGADLDVLNEPPLAANAATQGGPRVGTAKPVGNPRGNESTRRPASSPARPSRT